MKYQLEDIDQDKDCMETDCLASAFNWHETKEGVIFWDEWDIKLPEEK